MPREDTTRYQDGIEVERREILYADCEICSVSLDDDCESTTNSEDDEFCLSCYEDLYTNCERCSEELERADSYANESLCETCYDETHGSCGRCDYVDHFDNLRYDDEYGDDLCYGCYDDVRSLRENSGPIWTVMDNNFVVTNNDFINPSSSGYDMRQINGDIIQQIFDNEPSVRDGFKDSFKLIKSGRYQGVEIEYNTYDPTDRDEIFWNLNARLMASRTKRFRARDWEDYTNRSLQVINDGSVTSHEHQHGGEVVCLPRRGDVLYRDLQTITKTMKSDFDAYVSSRCGYHLHIDTRDYDWYHFAVLLAMTKLIEPHIFSWLPSSRRKSRWCHPVSQNWSQFKDLHDRNSFIDFYYDDERYRDDKYHDKRYTGLNLHSHFQANQGTELRYHSGTLNPDKMLHWSIVWSQIIDKCYEIGNDLYSNRTSETSHWFGDSLFLTSLSDIVCPETLNNILETTSFSKNEVNSVEDILVQQASMSRRIRRELGLEVNNFSSDGETIEYDFNRLSSIVGVSTGYGNHNRPTMTANGIFRLFDIPDTTREFYRKWLSDRMSSSHYADPNHVEKCFTKTTRFVEYNENLRQFDNVSFLEHRIPLTDRLEDIYTDVRYRLQPSLVSEYIDT